MTLRLAIFLLAALSVAGCASTPVDDPGGRWARQAEQLDNSLFY